MIQEVTNSNKHREVTGDKKQQAIRDSENDRQQEVITNKGNSEGEPMTRGNGRQLRSHRQ